jgi:tetratricopeptide (TPR) repeat protein
VLVSALEKAGEKTRAETLFQQVFDHYGGLCRDFPRCAGFHNKRAWLAAGCRRQLDQAIKHGRVAVQLFPKNSKYLDTLAEVHFQRREFDSALQCIRKCIELEPERAYFKVQLKRMQQRDPSTPIPEN